MSSTLRHETTGADGIWRGRFVGPGGYPITATLDLHAAERITRIRHGVEIPTEGEDLGRLALLLRWLERTLAP